MNSMINEFEKSKSMSNGGFLPEEVDLLKAVSKNLYSYMNVYAGFVVGNVGAASMEFTCAKFKNLYSNFSIANSNSLYFEDLLDRAKDYYYEAGSSCSYAFKRGRLADLRESAEYASTSRAFIERILEEARKLK